MSLFKAKRYHLIFLDLALPDRDGKELLEDLKAIEKDIKICVISGFLSKLGDFLGTHRQTVGNIIFCMKPISREEIIKITKDNIS
jgi:two-component SAPR family response regulator